MTESEMKTQKRVLALFEQELGYRSLGDWRAREGNSCIEEGLLSANLQARGVRAETCGRGIYLLRLAAENPGMSLMRRNREVYDLLRYGVPVKTKAGELTDTVHLVDWAHPERNDFAVAEEVTLPGVAERRPDVVLYVNGIAVGVLELKRGSKDVGEGIRQLCSNQDERFHADFFSTAQLLMAGNNSQGLRYGSVGTPAKYYLTWKEDEADNEGYKLDKYLRKLCDKTRLLELMHDFVLFDGDTKKLPRVHQYFGIQAARDFVRRREGGIIWHTQGSGKSIVMVMLARWILENHPHARVAIVTDRDELDKQIERVFRDAGETISRCRSGKELMKQLGRPSPRLICSLVHKFGRRDLSSEKDYEAFLQSLAGKPSVTQGEVFVFVDECHRTQSGKLHRLMKAVMPHAVFVGFTGTPLLKADEKTSVEVFGKYIHTYKFDEAVDDGVVLDLVYEARDVDQEMGSQEKIDAWFDAKTRGLNAWQKDELMKRWGTLQKLRSSRSRMQRVVADIACDFGTKPRLASDRGNAMLVASSIYEACRYYELFQDGSNPLRGCCGLVTSYDPYVGDLSKEETGEMSSTDKKRVFEIYEALLEKVKPAAGKSKAETYEDQCKARFIDNPGQMKLLIVVDKLLTGFDAPSCTYLYIDKTMRDHGLFQAICRTNRLDGDDKEFGYIVDYKDLFTSVEDAMAVYTSELAQTQGESDPNILLKDRLKKGRDKLEDAFEQLALICEPIAPPKRELEWIQYFCGNTEIPTDQVEREPQRVSLYKAVASLVRAFANVSDDLERAGYTPEEITAMRHKINETVSLRDAVKLAANETLDLKPFEADMRHLIDTYLEASAPRVLSEFGNASLLELIVKSGVADAIAEKMGDKGQNREAVAETIENNIRSKIVREHMLDPVFYDRMSALLEEVIQKRRRQALDYEAYLKEIEKIARDTQRGHREDLSPRLSSPGKKALYNRLLQPVQARLAAEPDPELLRAGEKEAEELTLRIDETVRKVKPDDFRGNKSKERVVKAALYGILRDDRQVEDVFGIIVAQKEY
ncbi:MAG: HsdR family type I site-specific deoxyribonuclease [Verrucomicrobia bacterium]|nr:HsdR family type I site-specific deoxyribonuclease [Verrucomicrobiota bacterium]MCH8512550.1 HsdR family type I site-specific deoxyribonuclease [Kiritimatiellia bacterium]